MNTDIFVQDPRSSSNTTINLRIFCRCAPLRAQNYASCDRKTHANASSLLGRPTQQITSGRKTGRSRNLGRQTQFRIPVGASDPQATANTIWADKPNPNSGRSLRPLKKGHRQHNFGRSPNQRATAPPNNLALRERARRICTRSLTARN